jgi:sugar phosphate isomerase/epimerase
VSLRRREFIAALAASGWAGRREGGRLTGDGAPERLKRIGIQLYTVRGELAKDVEGTLARIAAIGFKEVEFAGYPEGTAQSLRTMLDRVGLAAPSGHVSLQALRTDWERTLDQAALLGQRYIVVAFLTLPDRRTLGDWKRMAGTFNKAGEIARAGGIQFCYHNHDFEFAPLEGAVPYDLLLQETDPKLVKLELDLYWISKAGRDPLDYFGRFPGRFPLVHVKDMDATPRKFFADVGTGTIDFKRIFKQARKAGIQHYFYEQDTTPGAPLASAKASFDYLSRLTY